MKTMTHDQTAAMYRAASIDGHPFLAGFRDGFLRWTKCDSRDRVSLSLGLAGAAGFDAAARMNESGAAPLHPSDWIDGLRFSGWTPTCLGDLGLDPKRAEGKIRTRKIEAARHGLAKHAAILAAKAATISDEMTHTELRDVVLLYLTPGQEAALDDDSEADAEVRERAELDLIARETARAILYATAPNMRRRDPETRDEVAEVHAEVENRVQEIEDTIDELEAAAVATCELFEGTKMSGIRTATIARLRDAVERLRDIRF